MQKTMQNLMHRVPNLLDGILLSFERLCFGFVPADVLFAGAGIGQVALLAKDQFVVQEACNLEKRACRRRASPCHSARRAFAQMPRIHSPAARPSTTARMGIHTCGAGAKHQHELVTTVYLNSPTCTYNHPGVHTVDGQNPAPLESLMQKHPRAPLLILEAGTWVERKKSNAQNLAPPYQNIKTTLNMGERGWPLIFEVNRF